MPCAQIKVSVSLTPEKKDEICVRGCKILADTIHKPIFYCMCTCEQVNGAMGGTTDPMAFINIGSIGGLGGSVPKNLSAEFCKLLKEYGIEGERVYLVCVFSFHLFALFFVFSRLFFSCSELHRVCRQQVGPRRCHFLIYARCCFFPYICRDFIISLFSFPFLPFNIGRIWKIAGKTQRKGFLSGKT